MAAIFQLILFPGCFVYKMHRYYKHFKLYYNRAQRNFFILRAHTSCLIRIQKITMFSLLS